jgi:hypothetical protein
MSREQNKQCEIQSLLDKLESVYSQWEKKHTQTEPADPDAYKIINLSRALTFCTDPERYEQLEEELETLLHAEPEVIELSVNPSELLTLMIGLILSIQSFEAERYVKESLGAGVSVGQRWSKVAELMLIKQPDEKLRQHGDGELIEYWLHINQGLSPREAKEKVFKKFKFSSQGGL